MLSMMLLCLVHEVMANFYTETADSLAFAKFRGAGSFEPGVPCTLLKYTYCKSLESFPNTSSKL